MQYSKVILFLLLLLAYPLSNTFGQDLINRGILTPEAFGAKGNGFHDDTRAIQATIDSLERLGGGVVSLGSGTYLITTITLGVKISIKGTGNGSTIIKQKNGVNDNCIVIPSNSAALKISDLTLLGNDVNCGFYFENTRGGLENHRYVYSKMETTGLLQPYKWINIDNVCVYHFGTGLNIESHGFNINICNSTFSHNNTGVNMKCTDSSLYNCYVTNNRKDGLVLAGSNNRISNVKSIFNGIADATQYGAIVIKGSRCLVINCESQDNYGKGFIVEGQYNLISNCISNTDGYSREPKEYDPTVKACGFMVKGLYNSFSNCVVTNYNEKYGAVFHSAVIVDKSVSYYYPNIFDGIKVLIAKDKLLFHEPFRNVQALKCKNPISSLQKESIRGDNYFVTTIQKGNIIKNVSCEISNLNVLADFQCMENGGEIMSIRGTKTLSISVWEKCLFFLWDDQKETELVLDEDAVLDKDDMRLILSFAQLGQNLMVSLLCYEKTESRGWIKKEVRQDVDIPFLYMKNANVKIGDATVAVKRLVVTNSPLPESVFLPYSNTNKIYDSAFVYVDADSMM